MNDATDTGVTDTGVPDTDVPDGSTVNATTHDIAAITDGTEEWSSVDQILAATAVRQPNPIPRPGRLVPLLVGVVGSAAVFGVGLTVFRERVETDLTGRTITALATAGVNSAEVTFDGRDATVRVPDGTDVGLVKSIVLASAGPRAVVVLVDKSVAAIAATTTAPVISGDVAAQIQADGSITLIGTVNSIDARLALVTSIKTQIPTVIVVDNTTVVQTGIDAKTSTWVGKAIGELRRVGSSNAGVRGNATGLVLTGSVPTLAIRDAVNGFIAEGGLAVSGSLQINSPTDPNVIEPDVDLVIPEDGVVVDDSILVPDAGSDDELFGAAAQPVQSIQDQLNAAIAATTIEFKPSSSQLTGPGRQAVKAVSTILLANRTVRVTVIGHTDTNGDADSNVALSVSRAEAVRDALSQLGISADRMTVEGVGGAKPLVPNDTPANRKRNRRIEIQVSAN
jgi:outer membrane protein OmpA-like peptidoglycan-associated protein